MNFGILVGFLGASAMERMEREGDERWRIEDGGWQGSLQGFRVSRGAGAGRYTLEALFRGELQSVRVSRVCLNEGGRGGSAVDAEFR